MNIPGAGSLLDGADCVWPHPAGPIGRVTFVCLWSRSRETCNAVDSGAEIDFNEIDKPRQTVKGIGSVKAVGQPSSLVRKYLPSAAMS